MSVLLSRLLKAHSAFFPYLYLPKKKKVLTTTVKNVGVCSVTLEKDANGFHLMYNMFKYA